MQCNRIKLSSPLFFFSFFLFFYRSNSRPTHLSEWVKAVKVNVYKKKKRFKRKLSRSNNQRTRVWTPPHIYTGRAASVHIQYLCNEPDMLHIKLVQRTLQRVNWYHHVRTLLAEQNHVHSLKCKHNIYIMTGKKRF